MTERFLLNVPYYSQRLDVKRAFWRPRACGIISLKMAMDYYGKESVRYKKSSADQLIDLGAAIHARDPAHGWIHNGLVIIAKLNGFKKSYRKEWRKQIKNKNGKYKVDEKEIQKGVKYITALLKKDTPVLASMMSRVGGHLVVLTGLMMNTDGVCLGFLYHDPKATTRPEGKYKKIALARFMKIWKGRIIVVKK